MSEYVSSRIDYLDTAKGIGIILVYIGHCEMGERTDLLANIVYWIYSFHMPFFFLVSGLLFSRKAMEAGIFLWRKSVSLLLPYVIFSILNWVLLRAFIGSPGNVLLYGWGRNPLWFIPILYCIEVLHYFIVQGRTWQKVMAVIPLSVVLLWKTHYNQWLPYSISELTWFYFCFLSGYLIKPQLHRIIRDRVNIFVPISLFAIHAIVLFFFVRPYNINYRLQDDDLLSYLMRYGIGIFGSFALLLLSKNISASASILKWIGQNTMVILCTHKLYYEILQTRNYHPELMGG